MPTYTFRCSEGCYFDALFSMAEVPATAECRNCGGLAKRVITAPHLSATSSAAFQLLDHTARSAHEPAVVDRLPSRGVARPQRVTQNPLHAKLPRA
ncbi:zinc ribbon domain-containing protein [Leucobacter coleopterorum]|uniref:Zinc ribbon domain-containing protein n=1 Tax=Leucobacter coleopterorum TaxID=2714933 RepID=A0ABX6JX27_9MICO|nr:zinc ribbon domain-containing protein [Leucobacter coleopterorum]QIM18867.1 zinc ribbon domain-containing protein [Leucobacter coleopterorum]